MPASTPVIISRKTQSSFVEYYRAVQDTQNSTRPGMRDRFTTIDRLYQRETDLTDEKQTNAQYNKAGDPNKLQNVAVPVVKPQIETSVRYMTKVFLSDPPIFPVVASPNYMDEALQLQSIFENNAREGGWARELILFFRDGAKYNFAPLEVTWDREATYTVETNLNSDIKKGQAKQIIWEGNKIKRWDPYNVGLDTRVPASEVYKDGEFVFHTESMSRIKLKSFIAALPDKIIRNVVPAFESGTGQAGISSVASDSMGYFIPDVNLARTGEPRSSQGMNWLAWAGIADSAQKIEYKDNYEVTTLYCKVLPSEFSIKVSYSNTPTIYKLIIVNHEHIIYCEQQTNAHNYLPVLIGQPQEDGLSYQTKSLADDGADFQRAASTFMNSIFASRRRAISDRVLYDPSRITSAAINSPNPSAKIPVRPAAYGKKLSDSVYHFPYNEDQSSNDMQQIQTLIGLSNQLVGQNQVSQGQFIKGNKTTNEFNRVADAAQGSDYMSALLYEYQVFAPLKKILKLNTLQYQGGTTLYNRDEKKEVEIDPIKLRKAVLDFKVSDGLMPADKMINTSTLSTALQTFSQSPQLAAEYNMGPLFSYLMKTQGAMISDFEKSQEQVAYEQALGAWQQAVLEAMKQGATKEQLPPQPLPEQYGYNPKTRAPAPTQEEEDGLSNTQ